MAMDMMETLKKALQEMVVPELEQIRAENAEIKVTLQLTNKRLDDINLQLADHSRRIDETNKRIDSVRDELGRKIDETNKRIDSIRDELGRKIDETNDRLNRLYEVIVRRDEHEQLASRVARLEQQVSELIARSAA
jgi:chromosome segregation ATPase